MPSKGICPLCGGLILDSQATVPLTGGGTAHTVCADADSRTVRRRRAWLAGRDALAIVLSGLAGIVLVSHSDDVGLIGLAFSGVTILLLRSYPDQHHIFLVDTVARLKRWARIWWHTFWR